MVNHSWNVWSSFITINLSKSWQFLQWVFRNVHKLCKMHCTKLSLHFSIMSLLMTSIHNLNVLPMKSWSWHCGMFMKSNWCIHPRKETIALVDYLPSIVCRDWDFVGPPNKSIVSLPDASFQTWIEEFQVLHCFDDMHWIWIRIRIRFQIHDRNLISFLFLHYC